jgi:hypothetical protein
MADATITTQEQIVREAPEIEAQKLALLQSAKAQVDATNTAAQQGKFLTPNYQIAGMTQNQMDAIRGGESGIGAFQPYLSNAAQQLVGGQQTLGSAVDVLKGADTRNQYGYAQGLQGLAAQGTLGAAQPIGQSQISQYMNPYMNIALQQQLDEMNRQAQIQGQGLQAQATKAGAFGGTREGIQRAELGRNLAQTQNQAIANAMQQGYGQALSTAQQQQQAQMAGYNQLGNLGQGIGSLAGQQFGVGAQLAQGLGSLGAQQGNLATQAAALGQSAQGMGQQDVNFLYNLGSAQQKFEQSALDAGRQNQLQQNMQPYQQLGFLSDIYKGAPSTQMGVTTAAAPTPSPFQQIAGLGTGILSTAAAAKTAGGLF